MPAGVAGADEVWVGSDGDSPITIIDSATNKVITTISVPRTPHNSTFSPDGAVAFATAHAGDTVTMIDASTKKVVGWLPAGALPNKVGVTPDGRKLRTGSLGPKNITVVEGLGVVAAELDRILEAIVATVAVKGGMPMGDHGREGKPAQTGKPGH